MKDDKAIEAINDTEAINNEVQEPDLPAVEAVESIAEVAEEVIPEVEAAPEIEVATELSGEVAQSEPSIEPEPVPEPEAEVPAKVPSKRKKFAGVPEVKMKSKSSVRIFPSCTAVNYIRRNGPFYVFDELVQHGRVRVTDGPGGECRGWAYEADIR